MAREKHLSAEIAAVEKKERQKRNRIIMAVLIFVMIAAVTGEVIVLKTMTSVDRRFIRGVERGVAEGWAANNSDLQLKDQGKITDASFIETEYAAVKEFRNKAYKDKELKKLVKRYIGDLRKCREAVSARDPSADSEAFWAGFAEPYTDRLIVLRKLFLGDFNMGSSWDEYPDYRDEVLFRGWAAESVAGLSFEREEGKGVIDRFKASLKNDSGFDIEYLTVDVEVLDSNDKLAGTAEVYAENINDGSTAELSFYFNGKKIESYRITGVDCKASPKAQE